MEQDKTLVKKLVSTLFMSRDYTHLAHLKTGSYAKHIALNEFYDGILGFTDSIAEVAQGKWGKMDFEVAPVKGDVSDPIGGLEAHVKMIENLGKRCSDRVFGAILDEILALYYTTLYKLRELD